MKLTALRLFNVRRFAGRGVRIENIGDGVNVLCAPNEFGKSTSFDALHALFFQPHSGTPGSVQALRPYSAGSPTIEADVVTDAGAFRLSKRFYGGRHAQVRERDTGRLIAQADEAEQFIARLVRGGTGGPAGLLWVRQGVTGIERRTKGDDETEKRARETVLTSVQGEVEVLTGGRRMQRALVLCEAELEPLITSTGRPKSGGPYAAAIAERDTLIERERNLRAGVDDLRAALDRRRQVTARLAEIAAPEQERERRQDLAKAEEALAAAKVQSEALNAAQSEEALAQNRLDVASNTLNAYRQLLERHTHMRAEEAAAIKARDELRARDGEGNAALSASTAELEKAVGEVEEHRALLGRAEQAERAREAGERLAAVRKILLNAQAAREEVEQIQAAMQRLTFPADKIAALDAIERKLQQALAVKQARATRVRIDYAPGAQGSVALEGGILANGEEHMITRTTALEINSIGRLTLTMPVSLDNGEIETLEHKRHGLLVELGVESLPAARLRETEREQMERSLGLARQRLSLLAPEGLAVLQEEVNQLDATTVDAEELPPDAETVRERLRVAQERARDLRAIFTVQQTHARTIATDLTQAEVTAAGKLASVLAITERLGPGEQWRSHEDELAAAQHQAQVVRDAASAKKEALAARAVELAITEARRNRIASAVQAAAKDIAALREEAAGLGARIQTRAEEAIEETWQETCDKLAEAQDKVSRLEHEIAVLTRLRISLETARVEARDHYFTPVMRELRPLLGLLFEDATVTFDEDTLLPRSVMRNGLEEDVSVLSGGMREQLAILTRLAFARLLAHDGQAAPVILDDALVYSDDDRIEKMFDALHREASNQQIIILSCRQRAFAKLGGNVLRMEDWHPQEA